MPSTRRTALALAWVIVAATASAEEIVLRPRRQPGDAYRLALAVTTRTEASNASPRTVDEDVRLAYEALVVVLAVDEDGRPLRERHEDVRLTFERPNQSGSLFKPGTTYEVHRESELRVVFEGVRVERRLEETVAEVLGRQLELTLEASALDPRGPVDVGETWRPSEGLASRLLLGRGVRVLEFGRDATARLERGDEGAHALVVRYAIPVTRFALTRQPPYAEVRKSEGRLEGRIRFDAGPGTPPTSWSSTLTLDMKGVSSPPGTEVPAPWTLASSVTVEQSVASVDRLDPPAGDAR
jgi:hypothetical protein